MWSNIIAHGAEKRKCLNCIRVNPSALSFPAIAAAKRGSDSDLVEVLSTAKAATNHVLTLQLLRQFTDRVNKSSLPQLLAAVSLADFSSVGPSILCAWLLNEPRPTTAESDAKWIAAALLRQPQESQPLIDFARRVAVLPSPSTALASSGWSFFIAVFLFAASSTNEAATWLQQFPHRFSVTHPESREWFGELVRACIQQQQQQPDFWLDDIAPSLLRIVRETRNNSSHTQDKPHQQQVITAASNAASLLFAIRVNNFPVDLSGCVLEDCNLVAADFTNVILKSNSPTETQLRECVVERAKVDNSAKHLLEREKRRELLNAFNCGTESIWCVAFAPHDGATIVVSGRTTAITQWDLASGSCIRTFSGHTGPVPCVRFSPDGMCIASASWDCTVKLFNVESATCMQTLSDPEADQNTANKVLTVCFSPDGKRIASAGQNTKIKLWDIASGSCIRTLHGHTGYVCNVAFSPDDDGRSIVSCSFDKTMKLWDAATGACIFTVDHNSRRRVDCVTFSPDGKTILSGSRDNRIQLWNGTGKCIRVLNGHFAPVWTLVVAPDGKSLVSGSWDNTIKLWDLETGKCLRTFRGHSGYVYGISLSPDGTKIASGSDDQTVKVWDAATENCLRAMPVDSDNTKQTFCSCVML